jgi:hypothetical protein
MANDNGLWKLEHLSNTELLESLRHVLRTQHRTLAEVVAHLGEVEERRLHLEAAHSSMFAYCVAGLGMSEDEACRRIQLARLARKFSALYPELANGRISLSVALVLEPVLSPSNHLELLTAARSNTVRQARELVATRFPSPDVASSVRKLPEPRATLAKASTALPATPPAIHTPPAPSSVPESTANVEVGSAPFTLRASSAPAQRDRIEPLSAQRYKVQFTADHELKAKLEQARDLLRHTLPSGDFAPILARALDLLIDDLLRSRFGAAARHKRTPASRASRAKPVTPPPTAKQADAPEPSPPGPSTSRIGRPARRAVLERDGLGCSWVDAHSVRCGSQAWLEVDHRQPAGKGGSSEPDNLRLLCRAHNRLAAEHAYGREHIERMTSTRRRKPEHSAPK